MFLKTLLTEKPPVACATLLGLNFRKDICSNTQEASFITFVLKVP